MLVDLVPDECLHTADVQRVTRSSSRNQGPPNRSPFDAGVASAGFAVQQNVRTVSAVSCTRKGSSLSSQRTARSYASATRLSLARRTRVERVESKIRLSLSRGASELEAELARRGRQDPPSLPTVPTAVDPSSASAVASSAKSMDLACWCILAFVKIIGGTESTVQSISKEG